IADEEQALAAVNAGQTTRASLAIGNGMRDLRDADDLNGGAGTNDFPSYSAALMQLWRALVHDYIAQKSSGRDGTSPGSRQNLLNIIHAALGYMRGSLASLRAIKSNESAPPDTGSYEPPAQSCIDVLRSTAGADAYFAVDDSQ